MKKDSKAVLSVSKIASKVRPLHDRVLIRESDEKGETTTKSGIIIPITVGDDKGSKRGEVVAVGPGRHDDGRLVPVSVKVGDSVLFQWGDKIKVDGNEYYLVRESEILAVIK